MGIFPSGLARWRLSVRGGRLRRLVSWSLLGLLLAGIVAVQWIRLANIGATRRYLSHFTPVAGLGEFAESRPRAFGGNARWPHAVLLLHGYSSSPSDFDSLLAELERAGIPYFAPQMTGFGLADLHLVGAAKAEDWLRDAVNAYDLLAAMADTVSVVGHSNGGALATYVAEQRPVQHLVLVGPNLLVQPSDRLYKRILDTPVLSQIMQLALPVFKKPVRAGRVTNSDTLDPEAALSAFHYPALPIGSLKVLWEVQDRADITQAHFADLTLVHGEQDLSVDISGLLSLLDANKIHYTRLAYAHSAHNVLEDYDKVAAAQAIAAILAR